jgi:hypothetical protein
VGLDSRRCVATQTNAAAGNNAGRVSVEWEHQSMKAIMRLTAAAVGFALGLSGSPGLSPAHAQVSLSAYMDANGFINVQALTCAQLANTYQEDADYLAAWYSGWYNGLAKKHFAHVTRAKSGEHQLILYCKANPQLTIIQAIDILLKNDVR